MNETFNLYLEKANECLADAEALLKNYRYSATVSRRYYAMFYAAQAALYSENIEAFTRTGVNVQFQKVFIKSGRFAVSFGKAFSKIADQRLKSDYEIGFRASGEDALHTFNEAKEFVKAIRGYFAGHL
jgi:uncharacterized protein (UPF0332 family)